MIRVHKLPTTPEDPSTGTVQGIREIAAGGRSGPVGPRPGVPRHDDRHQHRHRAQRCHRRDDHDGGLPGHPPHREAQEAAQLLELPGSAVAALPGRSTAPPPHRRRAHRRRRLDPRPARRGRGAAARPCPQGGPGRRGRRVLSVLVPESRARAAGGRDRARGVPRGVPLRLVRGGAAVPGVRALLDRRA